MNSNEFRQMLLYGKILWPRQWIVPTDKETLDLMESVWSEALGDLNPALIKAAMVKWEGNWPPNPSELRRAALELLESGVDSLRPSWEQAWKELNDAVKRVGSYGSPAWSHPTVAEAVETLGYKEYCMSLTAESGMWRAQFRQIFENISARWQRAHRPEPPAVVEWLATAIEARKQPELGGPK